MHGVHRQQNLLAPMHTLEGFALDDERCFLGCDEALLNSLMHLGNQRRVLVTATGRINATKGWSSVWMISSSIRRIRGWSGLCIVCAPLAACSHDALHPMM